MAITPNLTNFKDKQKSAIANKKSIKVKELSNLNELLGLLVENTSENILN